MLNKIIRYLGYAGVYLWTGIQLFALALCSVSPVFGIAVCILDLTRKISAVAIAGKLWIIWLSVSAVVWLFFVGYTVKKTRS